MEEVVEPLVREYEGDWVTIQVAGERIEATANHPFWVVEGDELQRRPHPDHCAPTENGALQGRWVAATDLRPGDILLTRDARRSPVQTVSVAPRTTTIYNLHVATSHTFAVAKHALLVHNSGRRPTAGDLPEGFIKAAAEARQTVTPGQLKEFSPPPGSARRPGHVRSGHGWTVDDPRVIDLRNNPEKIYVGTSSEGNKVVVFWKDGDVLITDAADTTSAITAFGKSAPRGPQYKPDVWANDPNFFEIK